MLYGIFFLAAGVVLLFASEPAGLADIHIVAVALMAGGVTAIGISTGRGPQSTQLPGRNARIFSRTAACVVAMLLAAPLLTALAASLLGAAKQVFTVATSGNIWLALLGGAVGLLLLAATLTALIVGIAAIRGNAPGERAEKPP